MKRILPSEKSTELRIRYRGGVLILRIEGRFSAEERRALAQAIYKRIEPILGVVSPEGIQVQGAYVTHGESSWGSFLREWEGLRTRRALATETPSQQLGFRIRMRRLELGLSQEQAAAQVGISRTQLCRIERGKHRLQERTRQRLLKALELEE